MCINIISTQGARDTDLKIIAATPEAKLLKASINPNGMLSA